MSIFNRFNCDVRKKLREIRKKMVKFQEISGFLYSEELSGLCAISTHKTYLELKDVMPINPASSPRHAYCVTDDDIVIDLTASQFSTFSKRRFIINKYDKLAEKCKFYQDREVYHGVEDFIFSLKDWESQAPSYLGVLEQSLARVQAVSTQKESY